MLAGANGIGQDYDTSYDAFFVIDGNGIIRYRRGLPDGGQPTWRPDEVGPVVDQALANLLVPVVEVPGQGFAFDPAYPNPFNPSTTLSYTLAGDGSEVGVRLDVLDLRGRVVRALVAEVQRSGLFYEVIWDGRNEYGHTVASGLYLANLTVEGQSQTRSLTLVK
jgi:hypothetical protein